MNRDRHKSATESELAEQFVSIALSQDEALLDNDTARFNRLYSQMAAIEDELKSRPGDQRRTLTTLYKHPNAQVRLNAATATLAISLHEARQVLQAIRDQQEHPQALDAGMTIRGLDDGSFKPT